MNQKIAIWKRKLAKEKWKNQKAVWEKLSHSQETVYIDIETQPSLNDLLRQATRTLDSPVKDLVLKQLKKFFIGF